MIFRTVERVVAATAPHGCGQRTKLAATKSSRGGLHSGVIRQKRWFAATGVRSAFIYPTRQRGLYPDIPLSSVLRFWIQTAAR